MKMTKVRDGQPRNHGSIADKYKKLFSSTQRLYRL
jgi:hypothetical protein